MWARVVLRQFSGIGPSKLQILCKTSFLPVLHQCRLSSEKSTVEWVKLNPPSSGQPYQLTEEQINILTEGDPEKLLKVKELLLKLYIRYEEGSELPESVNLSSFEVMLTSGSNQLTRTLRYLVKNEKNDKRLAALKEQEQLLLQTVRANRIETESSWMDYKMSHNCLFLQLYQRSMAAAYNLNALNGLQFGQKIIFDCSMEPLMWERELKHTVKQILLCYDGGRKERRPFSLHLCNLDFNGKLMCHLKKQRPDILNLPIGLHTDSYLDLFQRENLVYIDQRASKQLVYNPEDIYIMAAIVDRPGVAPRTEKRAVKEGIKYGSLPLENYVKWKPKAQKYLCLHQYHDILMDVKNYGNWPKAIAAHLPASKYDGFKHSNRPQKRSEDNIGYY